MEKESYFDNQVQIFYIKPHIDNRGVTYNLPQEHTTSYQFISTSAPGTLRGLHYELDGRARMVTLVSGHICDVIVDVREGSPTVGEFVMIPNWYSTEYKHLWIPEGFAHGFYAYERSTILYNFTKPYNEQFHRIIRWDSLNIPWPNSGKLISTKDQNGDVWPDLNLFSKTTLRA